MKFLKKLVPTCLLTLVLVVGITLLTPKPQAATSGTCGDNLTWTLDDDGTLTISGTGKMTNWDVAAYAPWYKHCNTIKNVVIADSVASVGDWAFYDCVSLSSVTIPNSVTAIGDRAFHDCASLSSVTIPNGVKTIGNHAFSYCPKLTSVSIPGSVTTIGLFAFHNCTSLSGIWLDENNPNYSSDARGVLYNKAKTALIQAPGALSLSYTIPDSVTTIETQAFENCFNLTSVTIGDSVTVIVYYAFQNCTSLKSVTVSDSVSAIGYRAFYNCDNLSSVYYSGTQAQWESISISSFNENLTGATVHYSHVHDYSRIFSGTGLPTCTEAGYAEYSCAGGEADTYQEYIPALGHNYTIITETVVPTCTEQGYTETKCTRCKETIRTDYTDPVGHNVVAIQLRDATCTEQGVSKIGTMCDRCQEVLVEPTYTPALGHDYVDGICTRCQAEDPDYVPELIAGDINGDGVSTNDDVIVLLWHVLFPEDNPVNMRVDFDGDGVATNNDVIKLMWHVLFPEENPLN